MSEQIKTAAIEAGLEVEHITRGEFAFVKGVPHTTEGFLSDKPILLGRLKRGGKTDFYTISFREKEEEDVAVIRDLKGHEVDEFHATIFVPRHPRKPADKGHFGGSGCSIDWGDLEEGWHFVTVTCLEHTITVTWR